MKKTLLSTGLLGAAVKCNTDTNLPDMNKIQNTMNQGYTNEQMAANLGRTNMDDFITIRNGVQIYGETGNGNQIRPGQYVQTQMIRSGGEDIRRSGSESMQVSGSGASSGAGLGLRSEFRSSSGSGSGYSVSQISSQIDSGLSSLDPAQAQLLISQLRGSSDQLSSQTEASNAYRTNSRQVIRQAAQSIPKITSTLDNLFLRFPSCDELDRIILSADSAALLKTVQSVAIDQNVSCDQKIGYLLELQGRLRTAIEMKVHAGQQLKVVIDAGVTEVEKATAEVETVRKLITDLGLQSMKAAQKKQMGELEAKYGELNDVDGQLPILEAQVTGTQKQISILVKDNETLRSMVANDKLKLGEVSSEIGKIQTRLRELQDTQAAIKDRVNKSQQKVGQNEKNIVDIRAKIAAAQAQIKKFKDDRDRINSQVKDSQVKVERLRTDISVAESKKDRLQKETTTLESKLSGQKKKAVSDNYDKLTQMLSSLRDLIPSVQIAIDKHYYNCYGGGSAIRVQQSGGVTVYLVSGSKFGDYLKAIYGNLSVPAIKQDLVLNRVNIFGQDWTGKFGYPFVDSAFSNEDFSFAGSFGCMNPGSAVTGYGTISAIGANYIEAQDQKGETQRFSLGSCSRLQSTLKIPKIGQKFYWQGVVGSKGYNLYSGSCFQ